MPEFLISNDAGWYWLSFGTAVLFVEMMMPELLPMGLSVASYIFGVMAFLFPDTYHGLQVAHFLILSAGLIITSYYFVNPLIMRGKTFSGSSLFHVGSLSSSFPATR